MKTTAVTDTTHSIDTTCVFNSCKSTEEAHSWAGPSLSLLRYDSVASARNSVQRRVLVFLSYVLKLFRSYVLILFTIHIFFFLFCYIIKSGFPTFVQQSLLSVGSLQHRSSANRNIHSIVINSVLTIFAGLYHLLLPQMERVRTAFGPVPHNL